MGSIQRILRRNNMSTLLDLVKEDFGISGSGRWFRSDIHSSLVIDAEKDLFFFNSRDIKGGVLDYLIKVRGLSAKTASEILKHKTAGLPVNTRESSVQVKFTKLVDLFHKAGRENREYWYNRKLTDSTIDRYRLGNFEGWNLIPIYDDGFFVNFQCRRDNPSKLINFWYKDKDFKPVLFNKDILPFVNTIYITEGMVDCLLLNQLGFPSVCSTNGSMSWNQGWIKHFTKIKNIFYIADNDKAGIASAIRTANSLGPYRVKILRFKDKEEKYGALDFFRDGGSIDEFKQALNINSVYGFEKDSI